MQASEANTANTGASATGGNWTLTVVLLGAITPPMSMSGAGVAVPRIGVDLDANGPAAQWVVTAYFLTASSFMLVAGSLGDAIGRRRVYRFGAVFFSCGSCIAAFAPDIVILIIARALAGVGAAGVMAGGGAILGATFVGAGRIRAFAAMGTVSGLGLALGPSLSGRLIDGLGWRLGFGAFIFPGLLLLAGTWLIRETHAKDPVRVDLAGAFAFVVGTSALMLSLALGPVIGWTSAPVLTLFVIAPTVAVGFVLIELRARNPILNLRLVRRPRFMGWMLAAITMAFGFSGILAFLPSYLQAPVGLTATGTGLVMILPTLPMMLMPFLASRVIRKGVLPFRVITLALLAIAGGNVWLTVLHPTVAPETLVGPLVLLGAGVGLAAGTIDAQAMNEVPPDQVGMASGMLNTVRGTANTITLGLFSSALIALVASKVGSPTVAGQAATGNLPTTSEFIPLAAELTDSWRILLAVIAFFCTAGAAATCRLLRSDEDNQHPAVSL